MLIYVSYDLYPCIWKEKKFISEFVNHVKFWSFATKAEYICVIL